MAYVGYIEAHQPYAVGGWCFNDEDMESPVTLSLFVGDIFLRHVRADQNRPDVKLVKGALRSGFWMPLDPGLIKMIPTNTTLRLALPDGTELTNGKAENIVPIGTAADTTELVRHLDKGYLLDKWGALKFPFRAMAPEARKAFATGLKATVDYFKDRFGIVLFPHYGTLLGYARGKEFIPHDDDTDCSYVVDADYIEQVADHFFDLVKAIKADGHECTPIVAGQMHVRIKGQKEMTDIFTSWHQKDGKFNTYFGVSGQVSEPLSFFEDDMEEVILPIPTQYEHILALTYGPNWKTPDPAFQWVTPPEIVDRMEALKALGVSRCKALR